MTIYFLMCFRQQPQTEQETDVEQVEMDQPESEKEMGQ